MKRILALLLMSILLFSAACAEEVYTTAASMDGLYNVWAACASNDRMPYLVLHQDGTYEVYDWWMVEPSGQDNALLAVGGYTFDPADGKLAFDGGDTTFTVKTGIAASDYQSGAGDLTMFAGGTLLLLEAPPTEDMFDNSALFIPEDDGMWLLPLQDELTAVHNGWQVIVHSPTTEEHDWWTFQGDQLTYTEAGESHTADYRIDHGRMTLTQADGATRTFLLQYSYMPVDSQNALDVAGEEAIEQSEANGWSNVYTPCVILVTELSAGKPASYFYLASGEPLE